jgi:hypothetical protein
MPPPPRRSSSLLAAFSWSSRGDFWTLVDREQWSPIRDGAIYWRAPADQVPDFDEALSWLAYINVLEPECGCCAPCWPEAEPTSI